MKEFFDEYGYCLVIAAIAEEIWYNPSMSTGECFCSFMYYFAMALLGSKLGEKMMK